MKKWFYVTLVMLVVAFPVNTHANLVDRGNGLIYDTEQNLTWLKNLSPATYTWELAMRWADDLVYAGYDNWRLPAGPTPFTPYWVPDPNHEMGNLYRELGNVQFQNNANFGPFVGIPSAYEIIWTSQTHPEDPSSAIYYRWYDSPIIDSGYLGTQPKYVRGIAWAVADGDVVASNTAPIAEAGPDQSITVVGSIVQLDGTQSYDNDGDPITYQWMFTSVPLGSNATLSGTNTATPTFLADVHGTYIIQLVVSDPWDSGNPDLVNITFNNVRPVANAGTSLSAEVFQAVTLNGSGSTDANSDPLTYTWVLAAPQGSRATIADSTAIITTLVPDREGSYVIQLIVDDGFEVSEPSAIEIEAVVYPSTVTQSAQQAQSLVLIIPLTDLKNTNMQNTFLNKLNAVIASIQAGNYIDALEQLGEDILRKTDGCATSGTPDNNDWIKTCVSQNQLYPAIIQTIDLLDSLTP